MVLMNAAKIVLLVIGVLVLVVSLGLLFVGLVLYGVNTSFADSQGFVSSGDQKFTVSSYAIAAKNFTMNVDTGVWNPSSGDLITIKITASSNSPGKNVFIGVADEGDAQTYLSNVQYDEIARFNFNPGGTADIEYTPHQGSQPANPLSQTFWVSSAHGAGAQTLEWSPQSGTYWVILMNEDSSAGLDDDVRLAARIPILSTIGLALLVAGIISLAVAVVLLYFGIRQ